VPPRLRLTDALERGALDLADERVDAPHQGGRQDGRLGAHRIVRRWASLANVQNPSGGWVGMIGVHHPPWRDYPADLRAPVPS